MRILSILFIVLISMVGHVHAESYENVDPTGAEATVWYRVSRDNQIAFMDMLTKEFNNNNPFGIKITAVSAGHYGQIFTKFVNLIGTEELPDMVVGYQNQLALFNMPGAESLIDMNDLVKSKKWAMHPETMADIPDSFLAQDISSDFGNARLGFPPRRSMEILYANLDWLKELGYDDIPKNPKDFRAAACKASKQPFSGSKDPSAKSVGWEIGTDASRLGSVILAHGGETLDKSKGAYVFDNAQALSAAKLISEMSEEGCLRSATEKYGEQTDFGNGVALFTTGSSSGLPYYGKAVSKGANFNWSIYAVPHTTSEPRGNLYGPSFAVTKKSDKRKQVAVWLWLREFLKPVNQAQFVRLTNYVPVRLSTMNLLDDYRKKNPQFDIIRELMKTAGSETPPSASYEEVRGLMKDALAEILNGADYVQIMQDLNEEANRLHLEALAQLEE